MRMLASTILLSILSGIAHGAQIPIAEGAKPGMERTTWTVENWSNPASVDYVIDDGQKLLRLRYSPPETGKNTDKTAFRRITQFGAAEKSKLRLYVYAPDDNPPPLALAVSTANSLEWYESKQVKLKHGWNKIDFNLGDKNWKTKAANWEYKVAPEHLEDIRSVNLLIYNGEKSGDLYVVGMQYEPDAQGEKIADAIKRLGEANGDERKKVEEELVAFGLSATEALSEAAESDDAKVAGPAAAALREVESRGVNKPAAPAAAKPAATENADTLPPTPVGRAENAVRTLEGARQTWTAALTAAREELKKGRAELEDKDSRVIRRQRLKEALDKLEAQLKEIDGPPPPAKEK